MKNACSHIGKLPEFSVCNGLDYLRILYNPWVCHQKAGYIRPVLIQICMNRFCHNGARHIGTASGKGLYAPIRTGTVKARNHSPFHMGQTLRKLFIGQICLKVSLLIKENHLCSVNKFISQMLSQYRLNTLLWKQHNPCLPRQENSPPVLQTHDPDSGLNPGPR